MSQGEGSGTRHIPTLGFGLLRLLPLSWADCSGRTGQGWQEGHSPPMGPQVDPPLGTAPYISHDRYTPSQLFYAVVSASDFHCIPPSSLFPLSEFSANSSSPILIPATCPIFHPLVLLPLSYLNCTFQCELSTYVGITWSFLLGWDPHVLLARS